MSADAHDALRHEQENQDHDDKGSDRFILRAALEDAPLERAENDVRKLLYDSDNQTTNHGAIRRTDSSNDHGGEDEQQDKESEEGVDVHDDGEQDARDRGE